jgi:hypothetical protein
VKWLLFGDFVRYLLAREVAGFTRLIGDVEVVLLPYERNVVVSVAGCLACFMWAVF